MKKYLLALMMLLGAATIALPAAALPYVQVNSPYSVYLQGQNSPDAFLGVASFGNDAVTAEYHGKTITVDESETALGNGDSRITFDLSISSAGLFTTPDEFIFFGIGVDGNGFKLLQDVILSSATITLFDINNQLLATFIDVQDAVGQPVPWDGLFPAVNDSFGLGDPSLDATQVARISVDFLLSPQVNAVPEPGSLLLCAIGLLAAVFSHRRRRV